MIASPQGPGMLDRAIMWISPGWALKRYHARQSLVAYMAFHDAARTDRSNADRWSSSGGVSQPTMQELDLETMRERGRQIYRSDTAGAAVDDMVDHTIGTGFRPCCTIRTRDGKSSISKERAKTLCLEADELFSFWHMRAGINRAQTFWDIQRLYGRHLEVEGEAIAVLSDVGRADKPVPLALEVIDPERLETPPEQIANPMVRCGIEFDADGSPVTYWIRDTAPNDLLNPKFTYTPIPAARVLHAFEPWFAGAVRGYSWFTRAMSRLRDAADADEAALIALQVEACFAAFVEQSTSDPATPAGKALGAAKEVRDGHLIEELQPGMIQRLRPGEKITFANPQKQNAFGALQVHNYRRIAAAMRIPYEIFMRDWSGVSFAGGRLILAGFKRTVSCRQRLIEEKLLIPVWQRLITEAVIIGVLSISPSEFSRNPFIFLTHVWTPQAWDYALTPGEEVDADLKAVAGNFMTLDAAIAKRGGRLEETFDQRAYEIQRQEELGLTPVMPNSLVVQTGDPNSPQSRELARASD